MITLFVDNTKLQGPVAPVRWCVSRDYMEKLKELRIDKPYILFIIVNEREMNYSDEKHTVFEEVDRKFVPLDQAMEYFEFDRSGKHRIYAKLVWPIYRKRGEGIRRNLANNYGCWYHSGRIIINRDTGEVEGYSDITRNALEAGTIDIVVPDGHFASEPSAWERWWVNLWFEDEPRNQCFFRRRRLLAYSIQPFVVLPCVIGKGLFTSFHILLMVLCGIRGIRYHAIFHPFVYRDMWGAYDDGSGSGSKLVGSSVFITDSSGNDRKGLWGLLMPMFNLVVWGTVLGISYFTGLSFWSIVLFVFVIMGVILLGVGLYSITGINLKTFFPDEAEEEKRKKLEELYSQYQDLVCSGVTKQPSLDELPSNRRTVYLRFKELKSRVCLPYGQ